MWRFIRIMLTWPLIMVMRGCHRYVRWGLELNATEMGIDVYDLELQPAWRPRVVEHDESLDRLREVWPAAPYDYLQAHRRRESAP